VANELNGNGFLDRNAILARDDLAIRIVEIPEWGGHVLIRCMTAGERDDFEMAWKRNSSNDIRARLAVYTVCDQAGKLLFTADDIPILTAKSSRALDRIFAAATIHNGMTESDVEELRKNS